MQAIDEISSGSRFAFGENWSRFLERLDDERIAQAESSLQTMLKIKSLRGLSFLDIGSGSGLFSLAARRLGASVRSFDYDPRSVACAEELKRRYFDGDNDWMIQQGSVLDEQFMQGLGTFDIVYSWGVLHHTGDMWKAFANVAPLVKADGELFIAIYNDEGHKSRRWWRIKKAYNERPWLRPVLLSYGLVRAWGLTTLLDIRHGRPFSSWKRYKQERGMTPWYDVIDWVGGWPYEVGKPEEIFEFFRNRGFTLQTLITRQGYGCNEFVFSRTNT